MLKARIRDFVHAEAELRELAARSDWSELEQQVRQRLRVISGLIMGGTHSDLHDPAVRADLARIVETNQALLGVARARREELRGNQQKLRRNRHAVSTYAQVGA